MLLSSTIILFSVRVLAQTVSSRDGYTGYSLEVTGDGESAAYETANTDTLVNNATLGPPDVFLNASVKVGEIGIGVQNLSAKINLDAQVLQLLQFNAGVDLSIAKVDLTIQNITAKVLLEARLGNLVSMVDDVLSSIDLNPLIASLGRTVGELGDGLGDVIGGIGGDSGSGNGNSNLTTRSVLDEPDRVLFSTNDYSGNRHTNRILESDGEIIDEFIDNEGRVRSQNRIGNYASEMTFNGEEREKTVDGQLVREREYEYMPYSGLKIVSLVHLDAQDQVVSARVLSELSGGGTSTISN